MRGLRRAVVVTQLLFDRQAQILDQVETISNLPRRGRALLGGLGVESAPVTTDNLDRRMSAVSQAATVFAERSWSTSTTSRRSRSTTIVPYRLPFNQLQSVDPDHPERAYPEEAAWRPGCAGSCHRPAVAPNAASSVRQVALPRQDPIGLMARASATRRVCLAWGMKA